MTALHQIHAAAVAFRRIIDALDAREQERRGYVAHVPVPTDRELRAIAESGLAQLGGDCGG